MISGPLLVAQAPLVYRQDRNRSTAPNTPRMGTAFRAVAPRGVRGLGAYRTPERVKGLTNILNNLWRHKRLEY